MALLSKLLAQARASPIIVSAVSFGILMPASCLTQQLLFAPRVSWPEIARFGIYGSLIHGPFVHLWLSTITRLLPGTTPFLVLVKVITDQAIFAPAISTCFFLGLAILEGRRTGLLDLWREKVPPAWATSICVWPFLAAFSYSSLPPHLRPLYLSVCCYFWFVFMAYMRTRVDPWQPPTLRLLRSVLGIDPARNP